MSDDYNIEEEVLQKLGMTRERWREVKMDRDWQMHQRDQFVQGNALLSGQAKTRDEFVADKIDKVIEKEKAKRAEEERAKKAEEERAKKAEEESIEGWLRILHQGRGQEIILKVTVDTGATVNAITYGMLIDYQLEGRTTRLREPQVLGLAVGTFECNEQISINWMGKGNEEHDTSTFYVLPRGQANITDRVILSREWLNKRFLLYDKDPSHYLKPLLGGRQSESEKAARVQTRQQAMNDQASSSKAKEAYQKSQGQKEQAGSSSGPKEARK